MELSETTPPLPLRIVRWFLVPRPSDAAPLEPPARARARAARALVSLGERGLDGDLGDDAGDPSASRLAALANFRAALAVGAPDAMGVESVDALFDDPRAEALAGDAGELARCRRALLGAELHALAAEGEGALLEHASVARAFVRRALESALTREASDRERWRQRSTRLTLLALSLAAIALLGPGVRRAIKPDLAPGAHWRASTAMGAMPREGVGFHPREGEGNFFFQTQVEPEPWIEFDLGASRSIETVTVQNRLDCCQDWAVPLVIEVAGAQRDWREVGRRVEPFYFYTALFPRTEARYVRVKVSRMTSLHLGAVKIR